MTDLEKQLLKQLNKLGNAIARPYLKSSNPYLETSKHTQEKFNEVSDELEKLGWTPKQIFEGRRT